MTCEGEVFDYNGDCKKKLDCRLVRCGMNYEPVCGKKGLTYANSCIMQCVHNDEIDHEGECKPQLDCFMIPKGNVVCGVNGKIYNSEEELKCNRMTKLKDGFC